MNDNNIKIPKYQNRTESTKKLLKRFLDAAYRHVGETNMNVYSSRSHSIFRMVGPCRSLCFLLSNSFKLGSLCLCFQVIVLQVRFSVEIL